MDADRIGKAVDAVQPDSQESARQKLRSVQVRFASLGLEFGSGIAGFVLLGWWFDRSFQTAPAGIITAAVLGCVGGLYVLIRRSYEIQRELGVGASRSPAQDDKTPPVADDRVAGEERGAAPEPGGMNEKPSRDDRDEDRQAE